MSGGWGSKPTGASGWVFAEFGLTVPVVEFFAVRRGFVGSGLNLTSSFSITDARATPCFSQKSHFDLRLSATCSDERGP